MKNLFMATAAITLMMTTTVLTSCTSDNEDNPSTSNQEAIMVNTAALYDELGIRSEMAQVLGISVTVVKEHISALYGKLGASNRTEAVAIALRKRLLEL